MFDSRKHLSTQQFPSLDPDTIIFAADPIQREQIATAVECRGHASFKCSTLGECQRLLNSRAKISLVIVAITPAPDPLRPLHDAQELLRVTRVRNIPHFIAVSYLQRTPALEASLLRWAHAVFSLPARYKDLLNAIDLVDYLRTQQHEGISVEIEHTCSVPPTRGCLRGAEVARISIRNQILQVHQVKAGFVQLLLRDYLLRFTSETKPKRIETICDEIAASSFHAYWLEEEHITRRWFITNFSRLCEAIAAHCIEHLFTAAEDAFLRSETYVGKTTVYYSTANWHLTHEKGGLIQAA